MPGVDDIEGALRKIGGVQAARVVQDPTGRPIEIHIVAEGGPSGKAPKQLVRDIQTVAMANFGLTIDHRVVSVVQFPTEDVVVPAEARPKIEEVSTKTAGTRTSVRVVLSKDESIAEGEAAGMTSPDSLARLAGDATIEAVRKLTDNGLTPTLEYVAMQRMGDREVALATVSLGPNAGSSLSGSAVVSIHPAEAVVRAVLDAVNRRLWKRS